MHHHFIFLISWFSTLYSFSQEPHHIQYTTSNGLSSSEIYDIIQDDWGYLWISSDHGLNRFDGYKFDHYSTADGLTDNTIFRFKKDFYGRIWCTTYNNTLFVIEGCDPTFIPYKYNSKLQDAVQNKVLKDLYFDHDFNIYLTIVVHCGFVKIRLNGEIENHISDDKSSELAMINYRLTEDNNLFVVSPIGERSIVNGALIDSVHLEGGRYNKNLFESGQSMGEATVFGLNDKVLISHKTKKTDTIILSSELIDLGKFSDDMIWVSTRKGGVQFYDLSGTLSFQLLEGKSVSSVYLDHEGGLWIGTLLNGIFYFKDWRLKNLDPENSQVPVSDLIIDADDKLWLGYEDGGIYKRTSNKFESIVSKQTFRPALFSVVPGSSRLFYSANNHLFSSESADSTFVGSINCFKVYEGTSTDSIVFGKSSGLINYLGTSENYDVLLAGKRVIDFISIENETYLATQKGLFRKKTDEIELIDNQEVSTFRFNSLAKSKGTLIAGSRGAGVIFYTKEKSYKLNRNLGLASDFVNELYLENDSTLWVGTNAGISIIQKSKHELDITNIGVQHGLIDNHITSFAISGDTVWVGTHRGLTYVLKSHLNNEQTTTKYDLHFSDISVNDINNPLAERLDLSYFENRIEFHFLAFSFKKSEAFEYRYKLNGLEESWNYTTNTSVLYSSLKHGSYEFVVQFKGDNNSWEQETAAIQIEISPPFWKTIWFFLLLLSTSSFLVYLFFKYKVIIYNGDVLREILRYLLKRMRKEGPFMLVKEAGTEYKIYTEDILYVRSDRNYLEIHTTKGKHLIREKIGKFLDLVPDPIEFLRIKRSYIIRIDKVTEKGKKFVKLGDIKLEVGDTYLEELEKIII